MDNFLNPKLYAKDVEQLPTRNGYGDGLVLAAEKDVNVVGLCADLTGSVCMLAFAKKFPERFIQVGVAEQNMASVAAGLAVEGKIPFFASYAVFSPGRSWDQIRVNGCYNNANIKVVGAHAGISVGPDGATHQALEDIAIMRVLPNMIVIVPCDALETKKATLAAAAHKGPVYLRLTREKTPIMTTEQTPFVIGKASVYREGTDITIVGCGPLLYEALIAAEQLKGKVSVEVINCPTIKPMDTETILASVKKTKVVVTVEEHQITGGLGGAICELLSEQYPIPVIRVGMPDSFGESGNPDELLTKYGMKAGDIVRAVQKALSLKH
ncbi:MAG: transketolase C-terminal domain-containing protein [bacterium]|nr:transketolase C-terminal domain-containing protein [bacterium]